MHTAVFSVLLLCLASAIAQAPNFPDLPDQFQAKVTLTLPMLGATPGAMFYDYLNSRVRYDMQSFFGTATTIQRYDIDIPTEYDIMGGQCESKLLNESMNSMDVPPFAVYKGSETVNSVMSDHWNVNVLGMFNMDWWVSNSTDSTGKVTYQLVRFSEDAIGTQIDFGATVPGPVDFSYFDVSQLGCPPPVPPPSYSIAGYVKSAVNNVVIVGASVVLGQQTTSTDSNGRYQFTGIVPGTYLINASYNGFFSSSTQVSVVSDNIPPGTTADFSLSPVLSQNSFRVVLTWGAKPTDLDAHMKYGSCHVYYGTRQCGTTTLDVDKRTGFGPETITVAGQQSGLTYTYYVFNYSGESSLTTSNARIQLYGSAGLIADLAVPTNGTASFRYWVGFTIDPTGSVTIVNKLVQASP